MNYTLPIFFQNDMFDVIPDPFGGPPEKYSEFYYNYKIEGTVQVERVEIYTAHALSSDYFVIVNG